jgi:glutathione S-transferase
MTEYRLISFNVRGRSELSRLIFAAAGQKYEDIRISKDQWPKNKPLAPFGQLPYLEIIDKETGDVFKLAQTMAIVRYLAEEFNLAGRNKFEKAECDMYGEQLNDLFDMMVKRHFETDESKKKEIQRVLMELIPKCMCILESKLKRTNTGFLVGNSLTWIDLYTSNILDALGPCSLILQKFSLIEAHFNQIRSIPNIAKWLEIRPKSDN